jgi:LPXTG-site transpeptidase (sortase) family protein
MEKTAKKRGLAAAAAKAYTRKWSFLAAFVLVFFLAYSMLEGLGLTPEPASRVADQGPRLTATAVNAVSPALPTKLSIPELDREMKVANPATTDVATLDAALLDGAVRYPTSAKLGEDGNVVIFGHSSYLPIVHNEAFKAFNDIQTLKPGDRIEVDADGVRYVYAVERVYTARASEDVIPLTTVGRTLTLVTCDSFASKEDRFVVTAKLVERYLVAN